MTYFKSFVWQLGFYYYVIELSLLSMELGNYNVVKLDNKQYEVVVVNLNPTIGTEMQKTRPCLIISPNEMNYSNLIVAPLTSTNKDYPTRVKLKNDSFALLDQIRTISVQRVISKTDIKISKTQINKIKNIIKAMLVD